MSAYTDLVLAHGPALYWKLDETTGTVINDSSGNSRSGQLITGGTVSADGLALAQPGGTRGADKALKINGHWSAGPTQDNPGTGVRANSYAPYQPGASITLECWCYKIDPLSFATMFSSDAGAGGAAGAPHPTLEWGENPNGTQMVRWYANVNTYPVGWCDWGDNNTNSTPRNEFKANSWHYIAFTFNDTTGIAELYVDGRTQGQLGPNGYFDVPLHFETTVATGNFQMGFRGGPPGFLANTEVWGGLIHHAAVYERILTESEISSHWSVGATNIPRRHLPDSAHPAESIDRVFSNYFRLDR